MSRVFQNPFYCGLMAHGMLDGQVIEGTHPALISKELFLEVNRNREQAPGYGVPHKQERADVPLKVFMQCSECSQPMTGYIVKARNLWYYKCRTKGCKLNKSAKEMHRLFADLLGQYTVTEKAIPVLQAKLEDVYEQNNRESKETELALQQQLKEIARKLENIEYSYYVDKDMTKEIFEKFLQRLQKEQKEVEVQIGKSAKSISNPSEAIAKALKLSSEVATVWSSGEIGFKEKLQKLIFPKGIVYDRKIGAFRTPEVNSVFALIASLSGFSDRAKKTSHHF